MPEAAQQTDPELTQAAQEINDWFKSGGSAYEVRDQIRKFPKPICVDFNNVIASNGNNLELNPAAPTFLNELKTIGNVFIVTTASDWEYVQTFLKRHNVWSDDVVLMTESCFKFMIDQEAHYPADPRGVEIRREFIALEKTQGWDKEQIQRWKQSPIQTDETEYEILDSNLTDSLGSKRIAPLFLKPFKIPIIDDKFDATGKSNHGMLGIKVKKWFGSDEQESSVNLGETLMQAVAIVRNHYVEI